MTTIFSSPLARVLGLSIGMELLGTACGSSNSAVDSGLPDYPTRDVGIDRYVPPPPRTNTRPFLNSVSDQFINVGEVLELRLVAIDRDGDRLVFGAKGLPRGAALNPDTGAFQWRPTSAQVGRYPITFNVSDGELEASRMVTITVNPAVMMDAGVADAGMDVGTRDIIPIDEMSGRDLIPMVDARLMSDIVEVMDVSDDRFGRVDAFSEESGLIVDLDRDGYPSDIDCNDSDPFVRPIENGINIITRNITICPGIYRGASLVINSSSLTVNARGVALMGAISGPALQIRERNSVVITGLQILGGSVTDVFSNLPINIWNCQNITLREVILVGAVTLNVFSSRDVIIDYLGTHEIRLIDLDRLQRSRISNSTINTYLILQSSSGNQLEGNSFLENGRVELRNSSSNVLNRNQFYVRSSSMVTDSRPRIVIERSNDNFVQASSVYGVPDPINSVGILVNGYRNHFLEGNIINGNSEVGIWIYGGSGNELRDTTVTNQREVGVHLGPRYRATGGRIWLGDPVGVVGDTVVERNRITRNRGAGIIVETSERSTFTANDLRENPGGNRLLCETNTCTGNRL